jgi:hypothetical protein
MAINFVRALDGNGDSIRFQPMERLTVYLFGATVLFASIHSWVTGPLKAALSRPTRHAPFA